MNKTKNNREKFIKLMREKKISKHIGLEEAELNFYANIPEPDFTCAYTSNGTHYHHYGNGQSKKRILFLHAMGGNLHNWHQIISLIDTETDYYAIDLPLHGRTKYSRNMEDDYSHFYNVWLTEFLDEMQFSTISLVGHSLGARVSAVFSQLNQHRVDDLVLIAPALSPSFQGLISLQTAALQILAYQKSVALDKSFISIFMHEMLIKKSPDTVNGLNYAIEDIIRDQSVTQLRGIIHALKWLIHEKFDFDALNLIGDKVNTTILCGQKDKHCPNRELWNLADTKLKIDVVKQSGHLLPLEHPRLCSNRIQAIV